MCAILKKLKLLIVIVGTDSQDGATLSRTCVDVNDWWSADMR